MSYEIGQKVRVHLEVRDENDNLADATVSVTILKPNLTVGTVPTVVRDGLGLYHFDVTTDAVIGPWQWTATMTGALSAVQRGQFWVRDPAMQLMDLAEMKLHLNKDLTVHADDDELRDWIDAGKWALEREVGPILPRTVAQTFDGGRKYIILPLGPVISISSVVETVTPGDVRTLVVENGITLGDNEYVFDPSVRRLTRRSNGWSIYWAYGVSNVSVSWMFGRYPIPMNHKLALGELVSHLWRSSQLLAGGSRPNLNSPDVISTGFAMPNRVRELLGRRRGPRLGGR
jgi:hypothetical protein